MHRNARIDDLDFIYELIVEGAKDGYFDKRLYTMSAAASGLRVELTSILARKQRANGLVAYAIIYEFENRPVGFILMAAGEGNKGNELWMVAIHRKYRDRGHGTRMIQGLLDQFRGKNLVLSARRAPASESMYHILLKHGFKHVTTGEEGYRGLMYDPDSPESRH